ncbi:MAG TPA: outer membrane beta-barrel protein [Ohtaekwangia sp.]
MTTYNRYRPASRLLCLVVLFLIKSATGFGQARFSPGYIITTTSDTVRGLVNGGEQCTFKKSKDADKEVYSADKIKAYHIDPNKHFASLTIKGKTIFVEYLVDGIVDLYHLDTRDDDIYYLKKDSVIYELTNTSETVERDGNTYERKTNRYKGYLHAIFSDDPKIKDKIDQSSFNHKDMTRLAKQYHNDVCTAYDYVEYGKHDKTRIYLGGKISYVSSTIQAEEAGEKGHDTGIGTGLQIEVIPGFSKRVSLVTGFEYSSVAFDYEYSNLINLGLERIYQVKLESDFIRIPVMVQYNFPGKKVQPLLSVGLTNRFYFNSATSVIVLENGENEFPGDFYKHHLGFLGSAGAHVNVNAKSRVTIRAEYERTSSIQQTPGYVMDYQSISALLFSVTYSIKL